MQHQISMWLHCIFAGGLYAGATAGGNVKAHAGLGGGLTGETAAGSGFAEAQAGNRYAASGLVRDPIDKERRRLEKLRRKELKRQRDALKRAEKEKRKFYDD